MKVGSGSSIVGCSALLLALLPLLYNMGIKAEYGRETQELFGGILSCDLLSVLFLLPTAVLGLAAAVHSLSYLRGYKRQRYGCYWFFYNVTLATMIAVPLASSIAFFLVAWECMGLASFALVIFDWDKVKSRTAGWIYLMACHAGAAFLIMMFVVDGRPLVGKMLWLPALLGILGFGLKAGFPLLHVWLPSAHPAAPAPVSAIMSGAMIKLGLYGILRFVLFSNNSLLQCGWMLACLGLLGTLLGILMALPQRNIKGLLAYSSIENIGIMTMAYGLGTLGLYYQVPGMAILGFAGAILHMLNHAALKGALFLTAGAVYRACGTLNMERLGGLMKRMPWTGSTFAANALALSGLPPGNAFLGEFLIYIAAFNGLVNGHGPLRALSLLCIIVLATAGALALAVYAKVIGAVFLGEPRSEAASEASEVAKSMYGSSLALLLLNLLLLASTPYILPLFAPLLTQFSGAASNGGLAVSDLSMLLSMPSILSLFLIGLVAAAIRCRQRLGIRRQDAKGPTWDCGYAAPSARMEYTGTAFAQPLLDTFVGVLNVRRQLRRPNSLFPQEISADLRAQDPALGGFWQPIFRRFGRLAVKAHSMQSGFLHAYILTMVLALVIMLSWGMFCHRLEQPATNDRATTEEIGK